MKQKSIKNIRQEFKNHGIFYTPPEIAEKLKSYVDFEPKNVYDPTCGAGNLLSVFPKEVEKYGQELDGEQLSLIDLPNFTGIAGDTLMQDGFAGREFQCIVANPPFSVKWEPEKLQYDPRFQCCPVLPPPSKADWAFMLHILNHLSKDGIAVVLSFPGILYRGQREGVVRRWFVENNYIDRIVNIPANTFEDTSIATCIVILRKNRQTKDIVFEDGQETKTVPIEEIRQNEFVLSVNNYIQHEEEKEQIDPIELADKAREGFLERLKKELDFEKMVCAMEGRSMRPLIEKIKNLIKPYETEEEHGAEMDTGKQAAAG